MKYAISPTFMKYAGVLAFWIALSVVIVREIGALSNGLARLVDAL